MIIDYTVNIKNRPSEREVWLMSKRAQDDGHPVSLGMMRSMEAGELKYVDGKFYKLCRHCFDYLELDEFYANSRYAMGVGNICKRCTGIRNRIRKYATVSYITDVSMKCESIAGVVLKLNETNKEILRRKVEENELTLDES